MIILYGSYATGKFVEYDECLEFGAPTSFMSDYDMFLYDSKKFKLSRRRRLNFKEIASVFSKTSFRGADKCLSTRYKGGEKRLFLFLKDAYVDAGYNHNFLVTKEGIDALIPKVELLRDITKRIKEYQDNGTKNGSVNN